MDQDKKKYSAPEIIFETDLENTNVALMNDDVAYKGYAYLLVTNGYGCVCTVLFDRFQDLDACFSHAEFSEISSCLGSDRFHSFFDVDAVLGYYFKGQISLLFS